MQTFQTRYLTQQRAATTALRTMHPYITRLLYSGPKWLTSRFSTTCRDYKHVTFRQLHWTDFLCISGVSPQSPSRVRMQKLDYNSCAEFDVLGPNESQARSPGLYAAHQLTFSPVRAQGPLSWVKCAGLESFVKIAYSMTSISSFSKV